MLDSIRFIARNFDASKASNWLACPVWMAAKWSVQVITKTALTNCVLELQRSNDGANGVSFSVAKTFTAAGMQLELDPGSEGYGWLILKVTDAADNAGERVDVLFVGRCDTGKPGFDKLELKTIELETKA